MSLSLIVAVAENDVIGRDGDLPWRLSSDLQRFKKVTMGAHIIMGRKTYESIGRLLPGRTTVIVTRQADYEAPGAVAARSLQDAVNVANNAGDHDAEAFIIGGAELYEAALPLANRMYLTRVLATVDGDVRFPKWDESKWTLIQSEEHQADEKNDYPHRFCVYDRRRW